MAAMTQVITIQPTRVTDKRDACGRYGPAGNPRRTHPPADGDVHHENQHHRLRLTEADHLFGVDRCQRDHHRDTRLVEDGAQQ